MGLLEKALKYKNEINEMGRETLIDKIKGPAETEFLKEEPGAEDEELVDISNDVIILPDDDEETVVFELESQVIEDEMTGPEDDMFKLPDDDSSFDSGDVERSDDLEDEQNEIIDDFAPDSEESLEGHEAEEDNPFGPEDEPVININAGTAHHEEAQGLTGGDDDTQDEYASDREIEGGRIAGISHFLNKKDKKYNDILLLYEIGKDIIKITKRKDLYNNIIFSIMGQIGSSSSAILIPSPDDSRWMVAEARGVKNREKLFFDVSGKVLSSIIRKKELIDLEQAKRDSGNDDEYRKLDSIDARIIVPLKYNETVLGAVVIGDRITIGDYNEDEMLFVSLLCDMAAIALKNVMDTEKLHEATDSKTKNLDFFHKVDDIRQLIIKSIDLKSLNKTLNSQFSRIGIAGYAVFVYDVHDDEYKPLLADNDNINLFKAGNFSIKHSSVFIDYIKILNNNFEIKNIKKNKSAVDSLPAELLDRASNVYVYPFQIGPHLTGFILIFKIDSEELISNIEPVVQQLTPMLFSYILNFQDLETKNGLYIDNIDLILKRVGKEIEKAGKNNVPVTLIQITIKNLKRYYNLYGFDEAKRLIEAFKEAVKSRLSSPDFSVRFDINKYLVVLPGKNKKFAVPLANTLKTELIREFKQKEMQLLLTCLTAEFPADGENLYELLDTLE